MKKIGIVTFYTAVNYGVRLQALALQEAIKLQGYDAVIINYPHHKTHDTKMSKWDRWLKIKERIRHLLSPNGVRRYLFMKRFRKSEDEKGKRKSFKLFSENNLCLTIPCETYKDVVDQSVEFDACICGSDQIWNPNYTECNPVFFLRFVDNEKRISYAPSIGVSEIPKQYVGVYSEFLGEFASLSAREKTASEIVKDLTGRECRTVVDPTLLHGPDFWNRFSFDCCIKEDYILIYFLGYSPLHKKVVSRLETLTNLKILNIPICYETATCSRFTQIHASPEQFLSLVRDAKYVLTDSFHGVAFSVNYRKDFFAVSRNDTKYSLNSRIFDFLGAISLSDRIITTINASDYLLTKIDYLVPENLLEKWVSDSKDYLKSSLSEALNNGDK